MKVSLNWLKPYIDLDGIDPHELADRLTFAGVEVEAVEPLSSATKLVIGEVVECHRLPDSDHLSLAKVNLGEKHGVLSIVCGAPNIRAGLKVIVARDGASLPGGKITKGIIRGEMSEGMICSMLELGVDGKFLSQSQSEGIEELPADAVVGSEQVLSYLGIDDTILDLKLLANRSDLYSILNVAKEIGTLYQREVRLPKPILPRASKAAFAVVSKTMACPQFSARIVNGIHVGPSPRWLQDALRAMGTRSINNIVDIGNYIMLLSGQPLHMYDLDRLPKKELIIIDDYRGEFAALDGKRYALQKGDIAITSGGEVMCLGGVMGSLASAVTENTENIVVEVANFAFDAVRRTSTRLALASDSSLRFVKGINPRQYDYVMDLAAEMLLALCQGKQISNVITYDQSSDKAPRCIKASYERINNRLGTSFLKEEIAKTLTRDWIEVKDLPSGEFMAIIPDWRIDIAGEADLSEEVIRISGLDNVEGVLPSLELTVGGYPKDKQQINLLRRYLSGCGLDEVLTYSLVKRDELADFAILTQSDPYRIVNPLTDEHEYMRLSLLPSLLRLASYNVARSAKNLSAFEISDVDAKGQAGLRLGLVLVGNDTYRHEMTRMPYDFYHMKGLFEGVASVLGIKESRCALEPYVDARSEFHPGKSALIKIGGKAVGVLGELHPVCKSRYGLAQSNVVIMELDLAAIVTLGTSPVTFKLFSRFPAVKRDLSLVADERVTAQEIIKSIVAADRLIKNVEIFDVYIGEGIPSGYKSLALTITYENESKTLTDAEVNHVESAVLASLKAKYGIVLRS